MLLNRSQMWWWAIFVFCWVIAIIVLGVIIGAAKGECMNDPHTACFEIINGCACAR